MRLVDVAAAFLGACALAGVRLVRGHDLVNQRFVVGVTEQRVRSRDRRGLLTLVVDEIEVHRYAPFFAGVLAEGRTTMWPPSAPGTAPLPSSRPRSLSTRITGSVCTVRVTLPYWPAIRLPGNTRPGSCAIEIEPGVLCERALPCDARLLLKLCRV